MNSQQQSGYLEIILGSMYSGKTSRLVEIYKQCMFCNIPVCVINHCIDDRYDTELLSTHDQIKMFGLILLYYIQLVIKFKFV